MIKKDGKTTTVEAPEGSNVKVNDQGNVTVDVNKEQGKAAAIPTIRQTNEDKKPEQRKQQQQQQQQRKQRMTVDMVAVPDSYRLSPGDALVIEGGMNEIKHFGESAGGIIEVAGDGTITFDKLFGPIKVEGMTLDEVEFAVKKRIKEVCFNPDISIKLLGSEEPSAKKDESEEHRLADGDKVDIRISVTPDSKEFHEKCTVFNDRVEYRNTGNGTWKITGLTIKEAEKRLLGILRSQMNKNTYCSITLVRLKKATVAAETNAAGPPRKIHFKFRYIPWKEVLASVADQAGLSLNMGSPPPGTFNYSDDREFTVDEAIDLLNRVLLSKGYTLQRNDRLLMLINLAEAPPSGYTPPQYPAQSVISAIGTIEPEETIDVTAQVSGRIVSLGDDPRGDRSAI